MDEQLATRGVVCLQLVSAITGKLGVQDAPLPQELNEGVDSDEWVLR